MSVVDLQRQLVAETFFAPLPLVDRVGFLEHVLQKFPQVTIPVKHDFIDGLYKREIVFPAGTIATGRQHPVDHMDVLLEGEMLVATEDGCKHIKAPATFISRAGTKKAGIALTQVRWTSYHPTTCTTVEDVEAEIFCDDLYLTCQYVDVAKEHSSYTDTLARLGLTEDEVEQTAFNTSDYSPLGEEYDTVCTVANSAIHGLGLFSLRHFPKGAVIAPMRNGADRTCAGKYTNHSSKPNCRVDKDFNIVATRTIGIEELTVDYSQAYSVSKGVTCQV